MKLKNSNGDKTQKTKIATKLKTQNVTKIKISNCEVKKLKL